MMDSFSLKQNCIFTRMTDTRFFCAEYRCAKEPQIDIFFHEDYADYEQQLLGNSYAYRLKDDPSRLVAAFTIANSALVLDFLQSSRKNKINKAIPRIKQRRQYPALLIAQLAVFDDFAKYKLGDEMLTLIKHFALLINETTACRYLIVEAVNHSKVIAFYERNGFNLLYTSEQEEQDKMKRKLTDEGKLTTRLMMCDMLVFKKQINQDD